MCGRIAVKILCGIRLTVFIKDLLPAEEDGKTAASLNRNGHISYELEIGKKLTFVIKPTGFKHTGLFPEQASNWEWFTKLIHKRTETGKNVKVLNLLHILVLQQRQRQQLEPRFAMLMPRAEW